MIDTQVQSPINDWENLSPMNYWVQTTAFLSVIRFLAYPTALVKTQMQVAKSDNFTKTFRNMWKQDGIKGLYKGNCN